ncbi:MAG: DUF2085 domain-containing protein [Promethearchaeota archaeon]
MSQQADLSKNFQDVKDNFLRTAFLNAFICVFMIMIYVNVSSSFGSISTFFLENPEEFLIQFGVTLLLFTFFSVLSGPVNGLIVGFVGEYLFQLAFYNVINIEWCFLVGTIGFLAGMYKYKPLKYQDGKKIFYSIVALIILTIITMVIILIFQVIFHPNQSNFEVIFLNHGLKFLFQALISIIFCVPLLLVAYDKIFASKERIVYHELLTHHLASDSDHTFYLKFGRTKIYFCSRCSGVIIGGLIAMFSTSLIEKIYAVRISPEFAVLSCVILPIPGLIDWGAQRLLFRKATTRTRLLTGFIIGTALHFMSFTRQYSLFMLFLLIIDFSILGILMYFGHKKEKKILKSQLELDQITLENNI